MNIGQIITNDVANGPGIRLSLFVSGCRIHCKGCFQPQTWDFNYGRPFTDDTLDYMLTELSKPQYAGLTILGGEPFEPENQNTVLHIIRTVCEKLPHINIWVYSGCTWEELTSQTQSTVQSHRTTLTDDILRQIDTLVAGPFDQTKKDLGLRYRGSSNQQVINVPATLATNNLANPVLLFE